MRKSRYRQSSAIGRLAIVFSACSLATSCGGPRRAGPVDPDKARRAVKEVLESWRQGESLSDFQKRSPAITVQDMDWATGRQLVSYDVSQEERQDSANLHCPVKLRLRDADGQEIEKDVTYVIGTDPVTTVFREMML